MINKIVGQDRTKEGMGQEEFVFLRNVLRAHGVELRAYTPPYEDLEKFDNGFRKQLYIEYDYKEIIRCLDERCKYGSIYCVRDIFGVQYVILSGYQKGEKGGNPKRVYLVGGPYLNQSSEPDIEEIVESNQLELYHMALLKKYYNTLPMICEVESIIFIFLRYFTRNVNFEIDVMELRFGEQFRKLSFDLAEENRIAAEQIEKRYCCEDELLRAIEQGDQTKALLALERIRKYSVGERSSDGFRDMKNMMLTLNVLFRKAVQSAQVHPAHIDAISGMFAKRIEFSLSEVELAKINREMIKKYCQLVNNYSLRGYSRLIEDVINYIEFHLPEVSGLKFLAERFSVNASYMSGQFKKETNQTLTDYLNHKRIEVSLFLLVTTKLPIQEVAARVGIYDENYFSRLFKKIQNMTPREYRSVMRDNSNR